MLLRAHSTAAGVGRMLLEGHEQQSLLGVRIVVCVISSWSPGLCGQQFRGKTSKAWLSKTQKDPALKLPGKREGIQTLLPFPGLLDL